MMEIEEMTALTERRTALADAELLQVLQTSLYPGASLDSIRMVLGYCKAAGLDPMQKPVHIVPLWDRESNRMRDVIMPGVNLYRIQAARSGQFAGVTEPEFGPDVHVQLGGKDVTFPEWCRVTVRRQLSSGHVAEFTAREFWLENYAPKGGKDKSLEPNAMWSKRPRGQLAKCATAQALRSAFPELASPYTHEEMDGKTINDVEEIDPLDQPRNFGLTPAKAKQVRAAARACLQKFNEGDEYGAYEEVEGFEHDNDELQALWSILQPHTALRAALKRLSAEARAKQEALDAAFEKSQAGRQDHAGAPN